METGELLDTPGSLMYAGTAEERAEAEERFGLPAGRSESEPAV